MTSKQLPTQLQQCWQHFSNYETLNGMAADSKVTANVQHITAHPAWLQHRAMMAPAAAAAAIFHFPIPEFEAQTPLTGDTGQPPHADAQAP